MEHVVFRQDLHLSRRTTRPDNEVASVGRYRLVRNIERNAKPVTRLVPAAGAPEEDRLRSSSIFRKRSSGSLASAAAVKRATKLVRAKRSSSREELTSPVKHAAEFRFNPPSISPDFSDSNSVSPPKFRATSYAAESKTATRDEAVLLRSLLALVGKYCPSEFDKYQVLEERDKLLSKLRDEENKHTGEKARIAVGECPGMCPEKERYLRVVQKRISPFECGASGYLEPNRMVKEYARSAADQDNPLSHELRSKNMLQTTMDYLLQQVLDAVPGGDEELATWYDFLWSRTRAIRKEITQLMLSDGAAVALFERCARLHILCAYKLCHLGFDKFDQNMNTENLAKCLQSLRHLYEDLELQGEVFSTEAEMRGYDVMLHLHDSNIMRQVLSYRKEVRESQPVRLALQLSSALQNNNYVRFFRLLKREATFLQCCICHRYFDTVQSKALLTMMTAYGRHSTFLLDTGYLLRVLAWDSRDDALRSLALYGVHPNDMDGDQVIFDRDLFVQDVVSSARHYRWLDAKNNAVWSDVVHGPESFSMLPVATMTNSFDDSDRYNKDPVLSAVFEKYSLQDEAQQLMFAQQHPPTVKTAPTSFKEESRETHSWIRSTVQNVVHEVADRETLAICRSANLEAMVASVSDSLVDEVTRAILTDAVAEERGERERERVFLDSRRKEEAKMRTVQQLAEDLLVEVVEENLKAAVKSEMRNGVREYIDSTAKSLVDDLWRTKLWQVVDKEARAVLKKTIKSDMDEISSGLQRFREQMELLWLRQFWDVWRARVLENRRKREERRQNWETFQGSWHCKMFSPSNYAKRSAADRPSSNASAPTSPTLIDSQQMHRALRLLNFKKARSKRIQRKFFDKWRCYVERRRQLRELTEKMLHRPRTIRLSSSSAYQPSCTKPKRKRTLSPLFPSLHRSFLNGSLHAMYNDSNDSRYLSALEATQALSEFNYHDLLPSDSFSESFDHYKPQSVGAPFRPPSPRADTCLADESVSFMSARSRLDESLMFFEQGSFNTTQSLGGDEPEIVEDALSPKQGSVDLIGEAASLREKVLRLSEDVNSLIKRRKRVDAECRRTASQLSVSPRALSGHV